MVFLTRFFKFQESYEFACSLLLKTTFSRKTCGLSFLSSIFVGSEYLEVFLMLWEVVPIAILRYVWCRRCLFVHRHITLTISFIKHRISLSYIKDINEICRYNSIILNVTIIFFIELSDDTIYKFRGIISIQNFLFSCLYLLRNSTRNSCYSVSINIDSILIVTFWNP